MLKFSNKCIAYQSEYRAIRMDDAKEIVKRLNGTWHGSYGMVCCPAHNDRNPSLSVSQGKTAVLFKCFAGCDYHSIIEAFANLDMKIQNKVNHNYKEPIKTYGHDLIANIFNQTTSLKNTLGEQYLFKRGLGNNHAKIRFHPRAVFGKDDNRIVGPAIIVPMRHNGALAGMQRVFLDKTGEECFGRFKAVLCRENRASMQLCPAETTLAIAEGWEDAIAYTILNQKPCWALPGIEWLANTEFPEIVENLIVAFDNDKQSLAAFNRYYPKLSKRFKSVMLHQPKPNFKDWNEALIKQFPPPR